MKSRFNRIVALIGMTTLMSAASAIVGCERADAVALAGQAAGQPTTRPTAQQLAAYKARLGPESYRVLFEEGTEPPFRNAYHDHKAAGTYVSAATGAPLFASADKYDSRTGWPSFTKPIADGAVVLKPDADGHRVEVIDASSGGHLGHLFDDGPRDRGGMRYCMNSAAMTFVPEGEPLPTTRKTE